MLLHFLEEYKNAILASSLSAVLTKTYTAPITRIKILQQIETYHNQTYYNSVSSSFNKIYKTEGLRGFFKGNTINIIKSVPTYAIKLPVNDYCIKSLKKEKKYLYFSELLGVGVFSGFVQTIITYPLDLLRTVSVQDNNMNSNTRITGRIHDILKRNGVRGFYSGLGTSIISSPIYVGLQLSTYQYIKNNISVGEGIVLNSLFAGSSAGLISQTIMYPTDTIKKHLQVNNSKKIYNGMFDCVNKMYAKNGISGFYKGFRLNFIKAIPEVAIKFSTYDLIKFYLQN